jgi:hypothetical protein
LTTLHEYSERLHGGRWQRVASSCTSELTRQIGVTRAPPAVTDSARESVSALLAFAGAWLEPLAIEARIGCYDSEILTEGKVRPQTPFHLLVAEPRPAEVRIKSIYPSVESHAPSLSNNEVYSRVESALSQSCGDDERYQASLRELVVRASRTCLPAAWAGESLTVECYAGTIAVPLERRSGSVWLAAPPAAYGLQQPVELSVENRDGYLRLAIDIYWSPWAGEFDRPDSPLSESAARLAARGWQPA